MTLLVLDKDLGFLVWVAKTLEPGGHCIVPANSVRQAKSLLRSLKISIDLLVVEPALAGAAEFSYALRRAQPRLKVIALVAHGEEKSQVTGMVADATHARPDLNAFAALKAGDTTAEKEWVRLVQEAAGARTAGSRAH